MKEEPPEERRGQLAVTGHKEQMEEGVLRAQP